MAKKKKEDTDPHPMTPKRKATSGLIRDKGRTKARMVAAVGKVLRDKGYAALTAPNIARECGVDRKLVWTYFGGMDGLVREYISQKDFWEIAAKGRIASMLKNPEAIGREEISSILLNQFDTVLRDGILQKIIHWELGENNRTLRKVADEREDIGEQIFSIIEPDFDGSGVDLRASLAILIAGIYYLSLHAKTNGSTFCGIDINQPDGKARIANTVRDIVHGAYDTAGVKK